MSGRPSGAPLVVLPKSAAMQPCRSSRTSVPWKTSVKVPLPLLRMIGHAAPPVPRRDQVEVAVPVEIEHSGLAPGAARPAQPGWPDQIVGNRIGGPAVRNRAAQAAGHAEQRNDRRQPISEAMLNGVRQLHDRAHHRRNYPRWSQQASYHTFWWRTVPPVTGCDPGSHRVRAKTTNPRSQTSSQRCLRSDRRSG